MGSEQSELESKLQHSTVKSSSARCQSAECRRRRAYSVNVPLLRQDAYDRLQPLQLTPPDTDSLCSVLADVTGMSAVASTAAAAGDDDKDTCDAG